MNKISILLLSSCILISSCSKIRESAGVNRKNIDEFKVIENPPLVIPPNFNLLPPNQLSQKNIKSVESDLAKEIIFGLGNDNLEDKAEISTMENILIKSDANNVDSKIRKEINEEFVNEKEIESKNWENEAEILDSIAESERLRNKLLNNSEKDQEVPKIKINIKNKKKKRFFFF